VLPLAAESGVDIALLAQYGVLGIFAAMLVLFARVSYRREVERADRLEEDNRRLNSVVQDKIIPALELARRAVEESGALLLAMQRDRDVRELVDQRNRRRSEET
jgi:hypothetical protein